jgi:NADP-reducing hydrogenase subunit HndB
MKSLAELEEMKNRTRDKLGLGTDINGKRIVVGMATCGIAAGARPVYDALKEEIITRGIKDVRLTITGCIGVCRLEPIVEVYGENGDRTTYINMTAEKARRVAAEHIVNNRICMDLTAVSEMKG